MLSTPKGTRPRARQAATCVEENKRVDGKQGGGSGGGKCTLAALWYAWHSHRLAQTTTHPLQAPLHVYGHPREQLVPGRSPLLPAGPGHGPAETHGCAEMQCYCRVREQGQGLAHAAANAGERGLQVVSARSVGAVESVVSCALQAKAT